MDRDAKVPVLRRAEKVGFFGRRSRTAPTLPAVRLRSSFLPLSPAGDL